MLLEVTGFGALKRRNSNSSSSLSSLFASLRSVCWLFASIGCLFWVVSVDRSNDSNCASLACASSLSAGSISGELLVDEDGEAISLRRILSLRQYLKYTVHSFVNSIPLGLW